MEIQSDKSEKESRLMRFLKDPLLRDLSSFAFEIVSYYPEVTKMVFLKLTGLGKCEQKYCNQGDYLQIS